MWTKKQDKLFILSQVWRNRETKLRENKKYEN